MISQLNLKPSNALKGHTWWLIRS